MKLSALKKGNLTLFEFCETYNQLIHCLIEESQHYKCPKIEANYIEH